MMQFGKTSSEYPWWVKKISIGEDMIAASFNKCSCGQRQHKVRFGERGIGRTCEEAKLELIRQVNHSSQFISPYID